MVKLLNNDILLKIDELINEIEKSDLYQKYLLLKKQINGNCMMKKMINEVKVLQKDVVHHLNKKEELANKLDELNSHPLYREYINTVYEINNLYSIIENDINNYFQQKIN